MQKLCAVALVAAALTAGAVSVSAQTTNALPIVNATFTNPVVADGSYTTTVPGWNAGTSGGVGAVLNRTTSPFVNQTGNQLGQIYSTSGWSGFFNQTLSNNFVIGDIYTLTANFCNDAGMTGFALSIDQAGVAILASTPITTTAANTLVPFSVSWTNNSLSSPIEIAVENLGGAQGGHGLEFDNFQISQITPVPEPAGVALAAVGGLALVLAYRRRRSA